MPDKILILGGTREAAGLAAKLDAQGHDVTTSLAGRTREPAPVSGKLRIGGFGGAQGLAAFLKEGGFDLLIDATHPFARQISANASRAAEIAGVVLKVYRRKPWSRLPADDWTEVATLDAARDAIPSGARVFLALGSRHIGIFATRSDVHFVVRMVDLPTMPLELPRHELVIGMPSSSLAEETALFTRYAISHLVCRNSGGERAYAKIEAARHLKLPVIILAR